MKWYPCYACGKIFKTALGLKKDTDKHVLSGEWLKCMDVSSHEYNHYLSNYRKLNQIFRGEAVSEEKLFEYETERAIRRGKGSIGPIRGGVFQTYKKPRQIRSDQDGDSETNR